MVIIYYFWSEYSPKINKNRILLIKNVYGKYPKPKQQENRQKNCQTLGLAESMTGLAESARLVEFIYWLAESVKQKGKNDFFSHWTIK